MKNMNTAGSSTTGNSIEELLDSLKALDKNTKVKKINTNADRMRIDCKVENGKISDWEIELEGMNVPTPPYTKGKTFAELKTALDGIDTKKDMFRIHQSCDVLCYLDTALRRQGGKTVVRFYRMEPGFSYSIDSNGQPHLRIVTFELTDWEYERILETKLAFYEDGVIYPISKKAAIAVGSILDSSAAFKSFDERPLGSALLLAEKLEASRGVSVVYRQCTSLVKPIIAMAKKKYCHVPQYEFFEKAYAMTVTLSDVGFFDVRSWRMSDKATVLDLKLTSDPRYGIEISTGDYTGVAMSVNAYYTIDDCRIWLKRNSESHMSTFADGGYDRLFDGIAEAISSFQNRSKKEVVFRKESLKPIYQILGKRRTAEVNVPLVDKKIYDSDYILKTVIDSTYMDLSEKQDRHLCEAYKTFFEKIREVA